jgi:hydroxyacylglutathione hydrolase
MIAASLLHRAGWENLTVVLGGLAGWRSTTCPLEL